MIALPHICRTPEEAGNILANITDKSLAVDAQHVTEVDESFLARFCDYLAYGRVDRVILMNASPSFHQKFMTAHLFSAAKFMVERR
jgi:hypothetical protein